MLNLSWQVYAIFFYLIVVFSIVEYVGWRKDLGSIKILEDGQNTSTVPVVCYATTIVDVTRCVCEDLSKIKFNSVKQIKELN